MNKKNDYFVFFKKHFKKFFSVIILVIIIIVCLGIGKTFSSDTKTTKLGFEDIGELATQSAYCTEVNVTEATRNLFGLIEIPFTQSKYIYSYDIIIKAGYDFSQITWEVNDKTITIHLPEAKVLSNEIDMNSFKIYHEDESIFRNISLEETNEALADLLETAEKNAIENGLLENARSNAETILKGFFSNQYNLEEYTIIFTEQ